MQRSRSVSESRKHAGAMKTAAIDRFGPPTAIKVRQRAIPRPGPREILIRIDAAGVASWDSSIRDGSWRPAGRAKFPLVLGTDGAGTVVAKGSRVRRFDVGDRVYAYEFGNPKGGFYAEYVAVKAESAARVPARLDSLQAGAAAPIALTALQGIDRMLRVRRGQTVLIFGASGAVGTLAVQFARQRGARVLATATGRRAAALVRRLGANAVVDARRDDVADRLWKLAPNGIDATLALAGGEALERCLDFMRTGRPVAFPNGIEPPPRRRRTVRRLAYDMDASPQWFRRLERRIASARFEVPIAAVFPLARAAQAHERLARGHVVGSIVLRVHRASPPGN
jgi:NADPH:quinone reductase-like Zn-dependent oxidoreductase